VVGDRTYKLGSGTTSEPGRYVEFLGEPRGGISSNLGSAVETIDTKRRLGPEPGACGDSARLAGP
jgi:hypothetical protein